MANKSMQEKDLQNDLKSLSLKKLKSEQPEVGTSRVLHNFGDSDFQKGIEKIDLRKFMGPRNKVEATADFINNIVKVHHRHLEKHEQLKDQIAEDLREDRGSDEQSFLHPEDQYRTSFHSASKKSESGSKHQMLEEDKEEEET
jgi:hypothetical protein